MSDNAFYRDNESLMKQSISMNCNSVNCLDEYYNQQNLEELKKNINCSANNTRQIRNVDFERPMMWCEYRFKHLNYCNTVQAGDFTVCGDCKACGFQKNLNLNQNQNQKKVN